MSLLDELRVMVPPFFGGIDVLVSDVLKGPDAHWWSGPHRLYVSREYYMRIQAAIDAQDATKKETGP